MSGNPDPAGLEPETVEPRAPPITETQIRQTMRLSVLEGVPGICFLVGTGGSVLTGFALYLGATPFQIGLISSVPLLGQLLSPLVAWLAGRLGRRKPLTVILAVMGRVIWFPALILPALSPPEIRPILLLGVITLSSMFNSSAVVLWVSWMADVIPLKERGQFMGFRNGFLGVIGMGASLAAGAYLDQVASPADFQTVLGLATVLGIASALMLSGQTEPRISQARSNLKATLIEPFADQNFRRLLLFSSYWTFAVLIATPFVIPYLLKPLEMSYTQVAILGVIGAVSALVFGPVWGRIVDRAGGKPVLTLNTIIAGTLLPASWMLASPGWLWPIWVSGVIDAFVNTSTGQASFNLLLSSTPQANRTGYVAVFFAVTGLLGFIGGLLSGPLFELFSSPTLNFTVFGLNWSAYHWLFLISALLRLQAWRFLKPIREDAAWSLREMLSRKIFDM